jgi:hypothetical protein
MLRRVALSSSEASISARATRHIQEDGIPLQSQDSL